MTDLFSEIYEERAAICEFDAGMTREEAERLARAEMLKAEARCLVRWYYPNKVTEMENQLLSTAKSRGKEEADKLRIECRKVWADEMRGEK